MEEEYLRQDEAEESYSADDDEHRGPNSAEWLFLFMGIFAIDLLQLGLDLAFEVGVVVNRVIDVGVGLGLAQYYQARGIKMDVKTILSLLGTFVLEEIPDVDILPFWTLEVAFVFFMDKAEKNLGKVSAVAGEAIERVGKVSQAVSKRIPGKAIMEGTVTKTPPPLPGSRPSPLSGSQPPPLPRKNPPPLPNPSIENASPSMEERVRGVGERARALREHAEEFRQSVEKETELYEQMAKRSQGFVDRQPGGGESE